MLLLLVQRASKSTSQARGAAALAGTRGDSSSRLPVLAPDALLVMDAPSLFGMSTVRSSAGQAHCATAVQPFRLVAEGTISVTQSTAVVQAAARMDWRYSATVEQTLPSTGGCISLASSTAGRARRLHRRTLLGKRLTTVIWQRQSR